MSIAARDGKGGEFLSRSGEVSFSSISFASLHPVRRYVNHSHPLTVLTLCFLAESCVKACLKATAQKECSLMLQYLDPINKPMSSSKFISFPDLYSATKLSMHSPSESLSMSLASGLSSFSARLFHSGNTQSLLGMPSHPQPALLPHCIWGKSQKLKAGTSSASCLSTLLLQ